MLHVSTSVIEKTKLNKIYINIWTTKFKKKNIHRKYIYNQIN